MAFVLIGFMGAGKSTVARELAEALGAAPLDSDRLIEQRLGHPVAREFEIAGEEAFRAREEELVCELLAGAGPDDVIALGGGSVLSERVRGALATHTSVLLEVSSDTAFERVRGGAQGGARPLARDREEFDRLHAARRPIYEGLADAILPELPLGGAPAALASLRALAGAAAGTRLLWARSASGQYPVFMGPGLLDAETLGREGGPWPLDRTRSRPFLISDATVAKLYARRLGSTAGSFEISPGEQQKTLAAAELVWTAMVDAGITRADHVVALGGGVVGDLGGFCAATYQRGVPVVQVPTTLVAQVDSAYGGKTGVDLPQAKNYVGVYHQPAGVIVDPDTLQTLPAAELAAGWVEVLKTAMIAGGQLWDSLAQDEPLQTGTILACARTKLAVVAADERDGGARQALNLGHTVAHAIETATGYGRYRHGEAVGLGLLATLRLSGQEQLRALVRELLVAHGLPIELQGASIEAVLEATARDKKRVGDSVPFVLLSAPGEVEVGCEVPAADLRAAVQELVA